MGKRFARILVVIAGSLLPAFLTLGVLATALPLSPKEIVVLYQGPHESQQSETIYATSGEKLYITLKAAPSTGYVWELQFDPAYVELLSREYVYPPKNDTFIVTVCDEVFEFRTLKPGETEIKFSQYRPWLKGEPPADQRIFKIVIE